MTALERGLRSLALALHMTYDDLLDKLTMTEYLQWVEYFKDREREQQRAANRARGVVDFTDPNAAADLVAMVHAKGGGGRK